MVIFGVFSQSDILCENPGDQKLENFMREKLDEAVWLRT